MRNTILRRLVWIFPALALITIIVGQVCATQCAALNGDILGIDLNIFGLVFYGLLLAAVIVYEKLYPRDWVMKAIAALASVGAGAEFVLVRFQVQNGTYCTKCLISGFFFLAMFFIVARNLKVWVVALLVVLGALFTSFTFNGSVIPSYAKEVRSPSFGNAGAATTVIVYSDYLCPACRKVDGEVEKRLATLKGKVRIQFVDVPMHSGSGDYAEVFLYAWFESGDNLGKAMKVRNILFNAAQSKTPQREVLAMLKAQGIPFKEDKEAAHEIFRSAYNPLMNLDKVNATPTAVIAEGNTRKPYVGGPDIIKALDALSAR